ncbi:unnamed protein product [Rangifer tarandus platyrhynchus]|uniref:Uncharacterized protein n=1 Tax=Rangifer tarandus platyrhynchus TaxID=3082113 RepID=A0ABN8Y167_RANTA|nr:unnamed protein product [Rangifer tarandus platyrhynchus]
MSWLLYDEFRGQVLASCDIITPKYTGVSVFYLKPSSPLIPEPLLIRLGQVESQEQELATLTPRKDIEGVTPFRAGLQH